MAGRIPLAIPDLRGNEAAYLARCVTDNWVSSAGPEVGKIDAAVANLSGGARGVARVNGTAALNLGLLAATANLVPMAVARQRLPSIDHRQLRIRDI